MLSLVHGEVRIPVDEHDTRYTQLVVALKEAGPLPEEVSVPSYVLDQWSAWCKMHDDLLCVLSSTLPIRPVKLNDVRCAVAFFGAEEGWELATQVTLDNLPTEREDHYRACGRYIIQYGLQALQKRSTWHDTLALSSVDCDDAMLCALGLNHNSMLTVSVCGVKSKVWGELFWLDAVRLAPSHCPHYMFCVTDTTELSPTLSPATARVLLQDEANETIHPVNLGLGPLVSNGYTQSPGRWDVAPSAIALRMHIESMCNAVVRGEWTFATFCDHVKESCGVPFLQLLARSLSVVGVNPFAAEMK